MSHGQEFFDALYQHTTGLVELRFLPSCRQVFVPPDKVMGHSNTSENCYFGVATRKDASNGTLKNCLELPAFFVDIDFKHSSEQEAREALARFPLPPSAVIHSGGGLHVYWYLKEPFSLVDDADKQKAKWYLRRLTQAVKGDQGSAEPAHILRVPGSHNHKYDPAPLVEIEIHDLSTHL